MKMLDKLYDRLTTDERFRTAVAAFARRDYGELTRLEESAPVHTYRGRDMSYYNRLEVLTYVTMFHVISRQASLLRFVAGLGFMLADRKRAKGANYTEEHIDQMIGKLPEVAADVKGKDDAWATFCRSKGLEVDQVLAMHGMEIDHPDEMLDNLADLARSEFERARDQWSDTLRQLWETGRSRSAS